MERRLAAILAADVVGYSRLVGEDEEGTLRTLGACLEIERACWHQGILRKARNVEPFKSRPNRRCAV